MSRARWHVRGAAAGFVGAVILLMVAGAAAATAPSGSGIAHEALQIRSASLAQNGRQFAWSVQLEQPFSPAALANDRRSLCLLFERVVSESVRGQLCVEGPAAHSDAPRLVFTNLASNGSGPGKVITATVTQPASSELQASFLPGAVGLGYGPIRWQVVSTLRGSACAVATPGGSCSVLYPAKPTLLPMHTPVLVGCVPSGPTIVYQGPTSQHEIALTFDDGPWYDTPQFLDVLEREHVVATFFQIGDQITEYARRGLDRRMLSDGDMIGDHTWNYGGDVAAGGADAVSQIVQGADAIRRVTGGFEPCLFRAPGGNFTPGLLRTARTLGFTTIQWDVDPRDWALPGTVAIYDNVVSNAHNGAIIIQHDGGGNRSETLAALPEEIATLRARGYRFVTVDQMLGYKLVYR